jgi:hypothetical protein
VTGFTLHTATVFCSPPKITASWRHLLWGRSKVKVEAVDTSRMAGGNSPESDIPVSPDVGAEYTSRLHEYGLGSGLSKPTAA